MTCSEGIDMLVAAAAAAVSSVLTRLAGGEDPLGKGSAVEDIVLGEEEVGWVVVVTSCGGLVGDGRGDALTRIGARWRFWLLLLSGFARVGKWADVLVCRQHR